MRKRRRKKKATSSEVELNMAAMLDMAFQLLAFFILTFKPSPVEAQISLRIPTLQTTSESGKPPEEDVEKTDFGLSLNIRVLANGAGELTGTEIETQTLPSSGDVAQDLQRFKAKLQETLSGANFESMIISFSDDLSYERMIQVLDICAHQNKSNGEPFTNISIGSLKR